MRNSAYPYYFLSIFQSMDKCRNCGVVGKEAKKKWKKQLFFWFFKTCTGHAVCTFVPVNITDPSRATVAPALIGNSVQWLLVARILFSYNALTSSQRIFVLFNSSRLTHCPGDPNRVQWIFVWVVFNWIIRTPHIRTVDLDPPPTSFVKSYNRTCWSLISPFTATTISPFPYVI